VKAPVPVFLKCFNILALPLGSLERIVDIFLALAVATRHEPRLFKLVSLLHGLERNGTAYWHVVDISGHTVLRYITNPAFSNWLVHPWRREQWDRLLACS
jgi:hypothetical protein